MRIILAAAVILLLLAGCGTSTPPTSYEAPNAPSTSLSADEQQSYDYIASHIDELDDFYDQIMNAAKNWSPSDDSALMACGDTWVALKDEWEASPAANGKVATLELAYQDAGNAVHECMMLMFDITSGNTPTEAEMEDVAMNAQIALESCRDELANVDTGSY